jgi:molybdopterin-guanine dinucleotide biosynthesis protein A
VAAATGFVVAGGQSRRMGRDKALLPWAGVTLLDRALRTLQQVCGRVSILCGPVARYEDRGVPLLVDRLHGAGPLAGVIAGLETLGEEPGAFLAVDLPGVPAALLADLIRRSAEADAVVPLSSSGPEPLCAVYTRACLEPARRRIAAGERRMTSFWPDVRVATVPWAELAPFGDPAVMFRNINTAHDLPSE